MKNKKILVLTSQYPHGTPMSFRINAFIATFKSLGHKVVVLCEQMTDPECLINGHYEKDDIDVYTYSKNISNRNRIYIPAIFPKDLSEIIRIERPNYIFSISDYSKFFFTDLICKKNNIPLILESCEDYDPSTFKYGRFDLNYILHRLNWRFFYKRANGVVAISRLLESHYLKFTNNVIRIPTIADVCTTPCNLEPNENKIVLFFAGNFARGKDTIAPFVKALDGIKEYEKFEFKVCGVTATDVEAHVGEEYYQKYKGQFNIMGKIPQYQVTSEYQTADFGIFFRPLRRSSFAGFSTKLGEGMATGTPFIVNDTGDISLYIKNGENGYLANDIDEITTVYDDIIRSTCERRRAMRTAARLTAEKSFDYRNYKEPLRELLNDLEG